MAKKKMTKARAASARREETPESLKRERNKEHARQIKQAAAHAQKQASKTNSFRFVLPFFLVAAIVALALVVTIAPGFLMGS